MTNCASWWHPVRQVWPTVGGGVQPGMKGVPSFAVRAGSAWNALQASGNQPSICNPLTGGVVGCVYFELSVPEPGGGKPMPVRLCGSVKGLPVVVRSATW